MKDVSRSPFGTRRIVNPDLSSPQGQSLIYCPHLWEGSGRPGVKVAYRDVMIHPISVYDKALTQNSEQAVLSLQYPERSLRLVEDGIYK